MVKNQPYSGSEIDFMLDNIVDREEPTQILLSSPEYFDIIDVKNVHMEGQLGQLDKGLATKQWNELKGKYEQMQKAGLLENVHVIPGQAGCEDMVFAANQSFPWKLNGKKVVVMSKMFHTSRKREVVFFEAFYKSIGYSILTLKNTEFFEGMGDTIPHPFKNLLYGGYGHRSTKEAYTELSGLLKVPIVTLELKDDRFYHLDTCFVPLDSQTVLICKEAFTAEGLKAIHVLFSKVITIPLEEAQHFFALNAHVIHVPAGKQRTVIIQQGAPVTNAILQQFGFEVIELETSEFMKSGGSVFCMKMMIY